eukprot:gnl/TRDRNA2_/TRDRNA2_61803_c0_seq1.p1 gnl/TRDRNA2_/TRDRNA2_61803_c0~~gnl/TRDRNA2_/TRDRNA2_61803_c0_seq1.p1  ORF type:complete len:290 (-),score=49.44 gnl/TRDRNA2_/TRDRNA2_61803_c0_seq1:267-1136(-)
MGASMSVCGNCFSAAVLLSTDITVSVLQGSARLLVDAVDHICGSGHNTSRKKIAWHPQRYFTTPQYAAERGTQGFTGELNVKATLETSTFPIKPDDLIAKTREVLLSEFGTAPGCDASCLADDFQFVAPIVGPLSKTEFMRAFGSFKVKEALPDIAENSWFQVDPMEPNRVWFFSRATATHTGTLYFGNPLLPTGKEIHMPPQAQSMLFNAEGKVYTLTVGYAMDKRIGNTDGLGGVFGILKAVGKPLPFPEGQRLYTPSLRYEGFEHIAKAVEGMGYDPTTRQKLPAK